VTVHVAATEVGACLAELPCRRLLLLSALHLQHHCLCQLSVLLLLLLNQSLMLLLLLPLVVVVLLLNLLELALEELLEVTGMLELLVPGLLELLLLIKRVEVIESLKLSLLELLLLKLSLLEQQLLLWGTCQATLPLPSLALPAHAHQQPRFCWPACFHSHHLNWQQLPCW